MPQFDVTTFSSQFFWLFICFVVLFLFSAKSTLPRLHKVFEERWKKIDGRMKEAELLNKEAEELAAKYESDHEQAKKQAHEIVLMSARQASTNLNRTKADLAKEHKKRFRDAELVIANKKADAMGNVQVIAKDLVSTIIQTLSDTSPEQDALNTAVSSSMLKRVANEF